MRVPPAFASGPGLATSSFYGAAFLAFGVHLPFWPLWLSDWGLSEGEAGLYLSLAIAARIGAGVLGPWLADLTGRRRTALAMTASLGAAGFLLHLGVETKPGLLALTLMTGVCLSTLMPLGDAVGAAAARLHGFAYAQARAAGSATFLLTNLAAGWAIGLFGVGVALWWIAASLVLTAWLSLRLPGAGPLTERPKPADALRLLRARPFLLGALASAGLMGSHGPLYAYGSIQWRAQGISESAIGALWAAGVAVEVALMVLFGSWMMSRLGALGCFAVAGLAGLVRWTAMAFAPPLEALWALQALHALTFAPAHLGLIAFVGAAAPARLAASAQGLAAAGAGGLAMAAATSAAALLYPATGPGAFLVGAALSAGGLVATWRLSRLWRGETIEPGPALAPPRAGG